VKNHSGKCGCGKVEYEFEGEPINSVFCYCTECQTHTGSDKWFGVWVPTDKFNFTNGTPQKYTRMGDGDHEVIHHFCEHCGTTVCAEITIGNFYSVNVSSLEENNNFSPKMVIYAASASKWAVFPEGIPKFDILPPGMGDK